MAAPDGAFIGGLVATIAISNVAAVMLGVADVPAAVAFYSQKLGLRVIMQESQIALLQCGSVMIGLNRGLAQRVPTIVGATEVVFRVDSVRGTHAAMLAEGISFVSEPHQIAPTDWAAHFRDIDGHLLSIYGPEGVA